MNGLCISILIYLNRLFNPYDSQIPCCKGCWSKSIVCLEWPTFFKTGCIRFHSISATSDLFVWILSQTRYCLKLVISNFIWIYPSTLHNEYSNSHQYRYIHYLLSSNIPWISTQFFMRDPRIHPFYDIFAFLPRK